MLDPPTWRSSLVPLLHNVSVSGAPFAVMEKMSRASIFLPQHLFNLGPSQRRNEDEMKMRLSAFLNVTELGLSFYFSAI